MKIDRTKINIALKVLNLASKKLRYQINGYGMSAWVEAYSNCREQGLHLNVYFGGTAGVGFSFSESRSSDDIVVFWGKTTEFSFSNIPSEDTYRNRRETFPYQREDQAADFIVKTVKEQYKIWLYEEGGSAKIKEWKAMDKKREYMKNKIVAHTSS